MKRFRKNKRTAERGLARKPGSRRSAARGRFPRAALFALLVALLIPVVALPDSLTVVLREHCQVSGPVVRLSDVAVSVSQRALADLEIGKAPAPGAFARFSADFVRARVEEAVGFGTPVRVLGAEAVHVRRKAQTLTADRLIQAIRERVAASLPEGARCEVELVRSPGSIRLPAGELVLRVEPLGVVRSGKLAFRVDCVVDGALARTLSVTAAVRIYRKVVVAAHDLPPRTRITPDAVQVVERPLSRQTGTPLTDVAQALGQETRVTVRRGTVLTSRLLRQAPLVRRGERVRLVVNFHNVTAETYGRALQEGGADALVLVRNESSGRTLRGRVAGPGLVVVEP
ncbi:MAG TPA: flagellar basal body P-ring formation protein FlgA [Bacteroidetes bacterium]|nr:flagellar basal body P-ring formation protein FlgA [Bacteroidota bacterium]